MTIPDGCKGCLSYYIPKDAWNTSHRKIKGCGVRIPFISNSVKCPCMDCLLKMVCEEVCDKFERYNNMSNIRYHFEHEAQTRLL